MLLHPTSWPHGAYFDEWPTATFATRQILLNPGRHVKTPTRFVFLSLFSAVALTAGCNETAEDTSGEAVAPFLGMYLDVRVPAGPGIAEHWQPVVDEWNARTGADAVVTEYTSQMGGVPTIADAVAIAEDSATSVVVFPITGLAEFTTRGLLKEFSDASLEPAELDWDDVLRGLRESICSPGGRPRVVPLSCPTLVCYYRRDLLENAQLTPPQTWDEYQQLIDQPASMYHYLSVRLYLIDIVRFRFLRFDSLVLL